MKNTYFKLFSDCKLVRGYKNALIYDLNRSKFYSIEDKFANVISNCEGKNIKDIYDIYSCDIEYLLNELVTNEVAFFTTIPECFPEMSIEFENPSKVLTAIIEVKKTNIYSVTNVLNQLNELGCKSLLLIASEDSDLTFEVLSKWLAVCQDSFIVSIELILPFTFNTHFNIDFFHRNLRIVRVIFYKSPQNTIKTNDLEVEIIYLTGLFDYYEKILPDFFSTNVIMFCEANLYNLGLNRKVCITYEGNIKNFLSHEKIHGNVNQNSIGEVIKLDSFKLMGGIPNDKIVQCSLCKYRYCCISNSEIILKGKEYYKRNYCDYDVYNDQWNF